MPPNEKATCASGAASNESLIHSRRMQKALRHGGPWHATTSLAISQKICSMSCAWGCITRSDAGPHYLVLNIGAYGRCMLVTFTACAIDALVVQSEFPGKASCRPGCLNP